MSRSARLPRPCSGRTSYSHCSPAASPSSSSSTGPGHTRSFGLLLPAFVCTGGIGALVWTAFKVGALSFGGGFVIIPLMQGDAVHTYHWMSNAQFLNAVALGQVTPGPVVATVAPVGYAAHGVAGGLIAAVVAFSPSFSFILLGGRRFERLRNNQRARAFLDGAGPAAIGAILGAAILLAGALQETWQFAILAAAAVALLLLRARHRRHPARSRSGGCDRGARGRAAPAPIRLCRREPAVPCASRLGGPGRPWRGVRTIP